MWTKIVYILLLFSTLVLAQNIVRSDRIRWKFGDTDIRPDNPTWGTMYFNTDSSWMQYWNGTVWIDLTGITITIDSTVTIFYPIPVDSLVDSTITVMADSGLGGGGKTTLGDTVNLQVHVDGITINILDDTLRVDTTNKVATIAMITDSSQYYFWRAKSGYKYPQEGDKVLWNFEDFQTSQDSVDVCYFVENSTFQPYMQVNLQSAANDSHYVFPFYGFNAPRGVSDIADTLFIIRYKTTSVDTLNCGIKVMIYEISDGAAVARYTAADIVASTAWDSLVVLKTDGTLSSIVTGDHFGLIFYIKVDGDTVYTGWMEERWY